MRTKAKEQRMNQTKVKRTAAFHPFLLCVRAGQFEVWKVSEAVTLQRLIQSIESTAAGIL